MDYFSELEIYCDGGARGNPGPAACAFVVNNKGKMIHNDSLYLGVSTNNIAEYQAVILAMKWLANFKTSKSQEISFFLDSELVVRQINGIYKVKSKNLKEIFFKIADLRNKIKSTMTFTSVPRYENKKADLLVNKCLDENIG